MQRLRSDRSAEPPAAPTTDFRSGCHAGDGDPDAVSTPPGMDENHTEKT
jgi:hypothetical protein